MSNDGETTFRNWAKPPSETEQERGDNAEKMIREAIKHLIYTRTPIVLTPMSLLVLSIDATLVDFTTMVNLNIIRALSLDQMVTTG